MMDCYMYALIILIRIIRLVAEVANKITIITKIMRKPSRGFLSRLLGNDNDHMDGKRGRTFANRKSRKKRETR